MCPMAWATSPSTTARSGVAENDQAALFLVRKVFKGTWT